MDNGKIINIDYDYNEKNQYIQNFKKYRGKIIMKDES